MIGLLILGHRGFGASLIEAAGHTIGGPPPRLETLDMDYREPPERLRESLEARLRTLDEGDGVLILADIYGATHTNIACRLVQRGRIELIAGVNLPMLLKVLNYRGLPMDDLINKALSGGYGGIVCAGSAAALKEAGR